MNYTRFDLNLMTVLDVLLKERSVSRAAIRLNLSQPAVSHALARAREVFADPLLEREGSAMRPTPLALRLEAQLTDLLGGVERMLQSTRSFDPLLLHGDVRIGMSDYADFLLLPALLEYLRAHAPGLCILSRDLSSENLATDLSSGLIDMAISFKLPHKHDILEQHLLRDRHVCLAPKSMRGAMTLDRYLAERHVQISYRGAFMGGVDSALGQMGLSRTVAVYTPHVLAAASTAARARLVLTTPERLARSLVEIFPLKLHQLPLDLPPLELTMAWSRRNDADAMQSWLRQSIAAVAAAQVGAA